MRFQRWQVCGAIYVAAVCVVALALSRGDTYSYNLYLVLLGLTLPFGVLVPSVLFMSVGMVAVVFNIPLTGAASPFESTRFLAIDVVAFGAAAAANVFLARAVWLSSRDRRTRCRLLPSRVRSATH